MGNYFTKIGRPFRAVFLVATLTALAGLSSLLLPSTPASADGFGNYAIQVKLSNSRSDVTVSASRQSTALSPTTVTFTGSGTSYKTGTIQRTNPTTCQSDRSVCTWTISVKDKTGKVVGNSAATFINNRSGVDDFGTPTVSITVPAQGAPTNSVGNVTGKAQFVDTKTGNVIKGVPSNVTITFKQTTGGNNTYTATTTCTPADVSTCTGAYTISNMSPGSYTATMSGGYQNPNDMSDSVSINYTKTGITIIGGQPTTADLGDLSAAATTNPTCTSTDSSGNCKNTADDSLDCGAGGWNWVICSGIQLLQSGADKLDSLITSQLNVDTGKIFANGDTTKAYKTAWNSFRIIAIAVLVIAGLIMVTSQALGFEFLDAYTIRKVLPRLLIAIIGISISWPILQFVINFFDVVGYDVRELIYAPFNAMAKNGGVSTLILLGNPLTLIAAGSALFIAYGPAVFTFLLTGFLALMVAFLVLVIRQIAIIILVIMAPLAIACYILPNTQKVWKLWTDNFMGLMLMFPIVSALIAAGHVMSAVGRQGGAFEQFVSIIAYFAPYFMLPFAFRLATGAISTIAGLVNDRSRGAFDRLRNARNNAARLRHQMRASGQAKLLGSDRLSSLYRRASLISTPNSGALSMTQRGRERFRSHEQILAIRTADEALKNDGGRSTGNDEATALAVREGMTRRQFIREYAVNGRTEAEAERALAQLETGLGVQIGTGAMRVAAFKARAASSTAYSGNEAGTLQRINEGGALINAGLLTSTDTTAAGKGNRGRLDINGNGFGAQMTAFDAAAASLRAGGPGMTHAQAEAYLDETLGSADPGDLLAGNNRTVTAMAPAMIRRLKRELARATTTNVDGSVTVDVTHEGLNRSLGQIAGVQDNLNRTSPDKAALFDNLVNGQLVNGDTGGTELTVMQMVNNAATRPPDARGIQAFLEVRKEYGSARAAAAAGATGAPPEPEEH